MTILNALCSAYKAFKATMKGEVAEESYKAAFDVNHYPSLSSIVAINKQLQDENAELATKLELAKKVNETSDGVNPADTQSAIKAAKASVYWDLSRLLEAEKAKFMDEIRSGKAPHYISKEQFNYIADKIYSLFTNYRRNNID